MSRIIKLIVLSLFLTLNFNQAFASCYEDLLNIEKAESFQNQPQELMHTDSRFSEKEFENIINTIKKTKDRRQALTQEADSIIKQLKEDYKKQFSLWTRIKSKLTNVPEVEAFKKDLSKKQQISKDSHKELEALENALENAESYLKLTREDILLRDISYLVYYSESIAKRNNVAGDRDYHASLAKAVFYSKDRYAEIDKLQKLWKALYDKSADLLRRGTKDSLAIAITMYQNKLDISKVDEVAQMIKDLYDAEIYSQDRTMVAQALIINPSMRHNIDAVKTIYKAANSLVYKNRGVLTLAALIKGYTRKEQVKAHKPLLEKIYNKTSRPMFPALIPHAILKNWSASKVDEIMPALKKVYNNVSQREVPAVIGILMKEKNPTEEDVEKILSTYKLFSGHMRATPKAKMALVATYLSSKKQVDKIIKEKGIKYNISAEIQNRSDNYQGSEESFSYYLMMAMVWPDNPFLYFHPYGIVAQAIVGDNGLIDLTNEAIADPQFTDDASLDLNNDGIDDSFQSLDETAEAELSEIEVDSPEVEVEIEAEVEVEVDVEVDTGGDY